MSGLPIVKIRSYLQQIHDIMIGGKPLKIHELYSCASDFPTQTSISNHLHRNFRKSSKWSFPTSTQKKGLRPSCASFKLRRGARKRDAAGSMSRSKQVLRKRYLRARSLRGEPLDLLEISNSAVTFHKKNREVH